MRARQLAELSEGDLNELKTLLRENEDDLASWFIRWMQAVMRLVFDADPTAWADLYAYLDQLSKMPLEQQKACLRFGIRLVQNGFHAHMKTGTETASVPERWTAIAGTELSSKTAEMLQQLHYALERNANARIAFTASSFQWARTIHSFKSA
jgi:succinate dehydrogenase flavin-adding protein (antitoxin of CptAB toxin-antitoxin module)